MTLTDQCTECGRAMTKALRVYRGGRFCAMCYKRWFVAKTCVQCGEKTRAYRHEDNPVCLPCQRLDRRCIRCNRLTPRAALLVEGKPVCPGCAAQFKEPKPCPLCGKLTSRLARDRAQGIDEPVCESCRRKAFKTCSICYKQRKVHRVDKNGKPICQRCAMAEGKAHPCPVCGKETQGPSHAICESCQTRRRLDKRHRFQRERLASSDGRKIFDDFYRWFAERYLSPHACGRLDRYMGFFEGIDQKILFQGRKLDETALVGIFSAEELRKATTPLRFLYEVHGVVIDGVVLEKMVDERRIRNVLADAGVAGFNRVINQYYQWLQRRNPPVATKTISVYLRSALSLLQATGISDVSTLNQEIVQRALRRKTGLRASCAAFFSFLGVHYNLRLKTLASKKTPVIAAEAVLLKTLRSVFDRLAEHDIGARERKALTAFVLAKLYGLPLSQVLQLRVEQVDLAEGKKMEVGGEPVVLDDKMAPLLSKLVEVTPKGSSLLFAGRRPGSSLSVSAVKYWVAGATSDPL